MLFLNRQFKYGVAVLFLIQLCVITQLRPQKFCEEDSSSPGRLLTARSLGLQGDRPRYSENFSNFFTKWIPIAFSSDFGILRTILKDFLATEVKHIRKSRN